MAALLAAASAILGTETGAAQTGGQNAQAVSASLQREKVLSAMAESIAKQKASVRRQRVAARVDDRAEDPIEALPEFFIFDSLGPRTGINADCDPMPEIVLQSLIERASQANQVSAALVRAVMRQESSYRPCAVSDKGAMGLMQLMPATALDLGVADPLDPEQNAFAGAKLLHTLMTRYHGDLNRTLGAYNAGPGSIDEAGGLPKFPETTMYIEKINRELGIEPPSF